STSVPAPSTRNGLPTCRRAGTRCSNPTKKHWKNISARPTAPSAVRRNELSTAGPRALSRARPGIGRKCHEVRRCGSGGGAALVYRLRKPRGDQAGRSVQGACEQAERGACQAPEPRANYAGQCPANGERALGGARSRGRTVRDVQTGGTGKAEGSNSFRLLFFTRPRRTRRGVCSAAAAAASRDRALRPGAIA